MEQLQAAAVTPEQSQVTRILQEDFTRLLALVNEASALQKTMTPDKAATLVSQFSMSITAFQHSDA